ncbi:hypothetical protein KVP09_14225, partial [Alcaligenaceae bacterium CGII-47]|nr:hypothetical protein [Alcaligenaceae bacterium CGII-47]MBV6274057.1 hypothetical protein [Alcaligenaceae bacterium CGII-47]
EVHSPERALSVLQRIQTHRVTLAGRRTPVAGISVIGDEQAAVLASLKVTRPSSNATYVNL